MSTEQIIMSGEKPANVLRETFCSSREDMISFAVHKYENWTGQVTFTVSNQAGKIGGLRFGDRPFSCCGRKAYTAVEVYVDDVTRYTVPVEGRPCGSGLNSCCFDMAGILCSPCLAFMGFIMTVSMFLQFCYQCITCKTAVVKNFPEPVVTNTVLPIHGAQGGSECIGQLKWTECDSQLNNIAVLVPQASNQEKTVLAMLAWVWNKYQFGGDKVLASMNALKDLPTSSHTQNFFNYLGEIN